MNFGLFLFSLWLSQTLLNGFHHFSSLSLRRLNGFTFNGKILNDDTVNSGSFICLKAMEERAQRLSNQESEFMQSFWSDQLKSFQILPQLNAKRVSITSTCFALKAISENPDHWQNHASWIANDGKISIKSAIDSILNTNWSGDIFQTQAILLTLTKLKACDRDYDKYVAIVKEILKNRPRLSQHRNQFHSAYLRHMNVLSLLSIVNNDMVPTIVRGTNQIGFALERANLIAFDELCRQLAFFNSGDSANFDVVSLAYSLLSYWETSNSIFLSSFARGVVPVTNIKLIRSGLETIFAQQAEDGTWPKGEPINSIANPLAGNRDIGNNYVFFVDMLGTILHSIGSRQPALLSPYLSHFSRSLTWIENNIQQELLSDSNDQQVSLGRGYTSSKTIQGWRSNHLGTGGAVAWCTAQVFFALTSLRVLLRELITESIVTEFGGRLMTTSPHRKEFEQLMDSDVELPVLSVAERSSSNESQRREARSTSRSLKAILSERLLQPMENKELHIKQLFTKTPSSVSSSFSTHSDSKRSIGRERNSAIQYPPVYSLILFGPPGTAKTTICTSLAQYLGWHFLTIDTACFLANGLENIAARMAYIFNRLNSLQRTVILFDEIEEFCLDRENPLLGMESRLLTTAMLTQLNDLRRKQSSIFIVATNRLRSFDAAVIRPGRFDMLLFVGTPNLASRIQRLGNKLQAAGFAQDTQREYLAKIEDYFQRHWGELRFLTFSENESLLNTIVDLIERDFFSIDLVAEKIQALQQTATIQGSVRLDYEVSEKLSRL